MKSHIPSLPPGTYKVTLYNVETGEPIERWPVDARGMIECGEFSLTPPTSLEAGDPDTDEAAPEPPTDRGGGPAVDSVSDPVPHVKAAEAKEHSPGVPLVTDAKGSPAKVLDPPAPKKAPRKRKSSK